MIRAIVGEDASEGINAPSCADDEQQFARRVQHLTASALARV